MSDFGKLSVKNLDVYTKCDVQAVNQTPPPTQNPPTPQMRLKIILANLKIKICRVVIKLQQTFFIFLFFYFFIFLVFFAQLAKNTKKLKKITYIVQLALFCELDQIFKKLSKFF